MTLYSKNIIIFLLCLNAASTFMVQAGIADDWNINPDPDPGDEAVNRVNENLNETGDVGAGATGTLFGLFTTVANIWNGVTDFVFSGYNMLINLVGEQWSWVVDLLFAAQYALIGFDIAHILTGKIN